MFCFHHLPIVLVLPKPDETCKGLDSTFNQCVFCFCIIVDWIHRVTLQKNMNISLVVACLVLLLNACFKSAQTIGNARRLISKKKQHHFNIIFRSINFYWIMDGFSCILKLIWTYVALHLFEQLDSSSFVVFIKPSISESNGLFMNGSKQFK